MLQATTIQSSFLISIFTLVGFHFTLQVKVVSSSSIQESSVTVKASQVAFSSSLGVSGFLVTSKGILQELVV